MVYFQTKNINLGQFWRALEWKMLAYFMVIWNILRPFGIVYGKLVMCCGNLVYFTPFWYVVSRKIWHPWHRISSAKKDFSCSGRFGEAETRKSWIENFYSSDCVLDEELLVKVWIWIKSRLFCLIRQAWVALQPFCSLVSKHKNGET
jgi:hypothetical protein